MAFLALFLLLGSTHAFPNLNDLAPTLNLTTYMSLVAKAGFQETLTGDGPMTLFAPTDEAFAQVDPTLLAAIQGNSQKLSDLLQYHVVHGDLWDWDVVNGEKLTSLSGHVLRMYKNGGTVFVNNARVLKADIEASNGVIYLIDQVLAIPEGHIATILGKKEYNTTMFLNYLHQAHLDTTLNHTTHSRYTVFAPSDAAFSMIDQAHLHSIVSNSHSLRSLMMYHMHSGTMHFKSLDHNGQIRTLYSGHYIHITMDADGRPLVNQVADFEQTDIEADNGVVHIIDHVLIPSTLTGNVIG